MADPDLEIMGRGQFSKKIFSALRASVWSTNKGGRAPRAPPLDPYAYVNALRVLAETCDFGALKDQLVRDRIVGGFRENTVKRKLL